MEFVDTHCHIQFPDYPLDPEVVITAATKAGVSRLICVGCTLTDSERAIELASHHDNIWATIGIHPHEAKEYVARPEKLTAFAALASQPKVVAIGECGLDYFYNHSPKEMQRELFEFQIKLAHEHHLPLVFHVREAFSDFWPIIDKYPGITGVVHSFSATEEDLAKVLKRGFYVGLNGIMTFSKNPTQLAVAKAIPLKKLVLETDAPFLTPTPYRGTINESKYVRVIAEFLADLRGESLERFATATTNNAQILFGLSRK
jgi:TatD DNase family protein